MFNYFGCKARPFLNILAKQNLCSSNICKARPLFNHFGCKTRLFSNILNAKQEFCSKGLALKKDFCSTFMGAKQDLFSNVCVQSKIFAQTFAVQSKIFVQTFWVQRNFWPWLCKWWSRSYSILALTKGQHQPKAGKKKRPTKWKCENPPFPVKRHIYLSIVYKYLTCS